MNLNICKACGGELVAMGENWKCQHCGNVFRDETVKQEVLTMEKLLDEQKCEQIANLRRNLYEAITAEYIESTEICRLCAEIKKHLPNDFMANFFDIANRGTVKQIAAAIRKIDTAEQAPFIDLIFHHILASLCGEYVLPLQNLIERAFKESDLAKFEKYSTMLSEEAERVDSGMYETSLPRDVFVAYSSRDMEKVEELVETLEENGLTCFVAARNLRHGRGAVENYNTALEQAMDNCRSVVFVSTPNSRNMGCDAIKYELPYLRRADLQNAPAEYRHNYATMPTKYKKPRVEYRVAQSNTANAADAYLKEFFEGYEYAYSPVEVADRIFRAINDQSAKLETETAPATVKFCANCGAETPAGYNFCTSCAGTRFVPTYEVYLRTRTPVQPPKPAVKYCANCGSEREMQAKFCTGCGSNAFVATKAEFENARMRRAAAQQQRQQPPRVPMPTPTPAPVPTPAPAPAADPNAAYSFGKVLVDWFRQRTALFGSGVSAYLRFDNILSFSFWVMIFAITVALYQEIYLGYNDALTETCYTIAGIGFIVWMILVIPTTIMGIVWMARSKKNPKDPVLNRFKKFFAGCFLFLSFVIMWATEFDIDAISAILIPLVWYVFFSLLAHCPKSYRKMSIGKLKFGRGALVVLSIIVSVAMPFIYEIWLNL